jgi:hypothetical protein
MEICKQGIWKIRWKYYTQRVLISYCYMNTGSKK